MEDLTKLESIRECAEVTLGKGMELLQEGKADSIQQGILQLESARKLWAEVGDKSKEAETTAYMARAWYDLGELEKALGYYHEVLKLEPSANSPLKAGVYNDIGDIHKYKGDTQKALDYYKKSLEQSGESDRREDRVNQAITLNNRGLLYKQLDQLESALFDYDQALELFNRHLGSNEEANFYKAGILNNQGAVYCQQALELWAIVREGGGFATGEDRKEAEDKSKLALDKFAEAIGLVEATYPWGVAIAKNNMGSLQNNMGQYREALETFTEGLAKVREAGYPHTEAVSLKNIGESYFYLEEWEKATEKFQEALAISQEVEEREVEANILYHMARVESQRGNIQGAVTHIKAVIEIVEGLRLNIGSEKLRTSFFSPKQDYYELYVDLLMALGEDAQGLEVSERARGRGLLDLLGEATAKIKQGVDPALLEKERDIREEIAHQLQYKRKEVSESEQEAVSKEIIQLERELGEVEGEIRVKSPLYGSLKYPQPLKIVEIQQEVVDEDTILLSYWLGAKRSYLWAVTRDSLTSYELPSRGEIKGAARELYACFTEPEKRESDKEAQQATNALSEMVLGAVGEEIKDKKRLLVIGDGFFLEHVPFAALCSPYGDDFTLLLREKEIVTLPSASSLTQIRRYQNKGSDGTKTVAVFADPVYFGEKQGERGNRTRNLADIWRKQTRGLGLREGEIGFARLEHSQKEAEAIAKLVPKEELFLAQRYAASRETAQKAELSQYRYIHFAAHGVFDDKYPEFSGIALSEVNEEGERIGGLLLPPDIFNLNLSSAELVVLSACHIIAGKERRGEGIVGLTRGFMYAGAGRVVVSLWKVDDEATAKLMEIFYQNMLQEGFAPTAALRAAQLEISEKRKWQNPYYWAGFVLQGEYQPIQSHNKTDDLSPILAESHWVNLLKGAGLGDIAQEPLV